MQRSKKLLSPLIKLLTCATLALGTAYFAQAADATGTWTFSQEGRNGGPPRTNTFKLKVDGEKLTGTFTAPAFGRGGGGGAPAAPTDIEISEGKVKGDDISFSVKRDVNGMEFVTKYSGKVGADVIK